MHVLELEHARIGEVLGGRARGELVGPVVAVKPPSRGASMVILVPDDHQPARIERQLGEHPQRLEVGAATTMTAKITMRLIGMATRRKRTRRL